MPRFEVSAGAATSTRADLLVLPMFEGPALGPGGAEVAHALGTDLVNALRHHGIRGKRGETFALEGLGRVGGRTVMLIGAERGDGDAIREIGMRAGSASRHHRTVATTAVQLGTDAAAGASAFVEGFLLGAYRFDRHRSEVEGVSLARWAGILEIGTG